MKTSIFGQKLSMILDVWRSWTWSSIRKHYFKWASQSEIEFLSWKDAVQKKANMKGWTRMMPATMTPLPAPLSAMTSSSWKASVGTYSTLMIMMIIEIMVIIIIIMTAMICVGLKRLHLWLLLQPVNARPKERDSRIGYLFRILSGFSTASTYLTAGHLSESQWWTEVSRFLRVPRIWLSLISATFNCCFVKKCNLDNTECPKNSYVLNYWT